MFIALLIFILAFVAILSDPFAIEKLSAFLQTIVIGAYLAGNSEPSRQVIDPNPPLKSNNPH